MGIKPYAVRVQYRGDIMILSGVARSARGTKFSTDTLKINIAGMSKDEKSKAIEAAVSEIFGQLPLLT